MNRLYLDHNATAPLRPAAAAAMVAAMAEAGNASSVHFEGRAARARIEAARTAVARLAGAAPKGITFVGGGSEANATVLTPDWQCAGRPLRLDRLLVGATEHASVLAGGRFSADRVTAVPVDREGIVDRAALRALLAGAAERGERALVSVMLANNETGAIQPVAEISALAHEFGALAHTDAAQAAGRIPVDVKTLGVDILTLSAHKLGGPQGVGAVVCADSDLAFAPLLIGGGQEMRLRAGTENVAAIAGFGAAAAEAEGDLSQACEWAEYRDEFLSIVGNGTAPVTVFSAGAMRLPQTLCFGVEGMTAETLLIALDLSGVAVSSGSACSSGKVAPSHVLAAMGVPPALARGAIRLSFGWDFRKEALDMFRDAWRRVTGQILSGGRDSGGLAA